MASKGFEYPPRKTDSTSAERHGELEQVVSEFAKIEKPKKSAEEVEQLRLERAEQREAKAEQFAEKFGIADVRNDMLAAEKEYEEAVAKLHSHTWTLGRKIPEEVQERYDQARLAWRQALGNATYDAKGPDKIAARFIGLRDTALRAGEARNRAKEGAMDEKSKKLLHKSIGWGLAVPKALLRAYGGAQNAIGSGLATAHEGVREYVFQKEGLSQEKLAERYARASRIVSGAIIATVVSGGFGAVGLTIPLLVRLTKGTASVLLGASAGASAGKIYQKEFAGVNQERLMDMLRHDGAGLVDTDHLKYEEELYAKGNAQAREKARQRVEMFATMLVSGTTSIVGSEILQHSHFAHLPAVKNAVHDLQTHAPHTIPTPSASGVGIDHAPAGHVGPSTDSAAASAAKAPSLQESTSPTPVPQAESLTVGGSINNADKLLGHFQSQLHEQYPDQSTAPPAIQAFFKMGTNQDVLSRALRFQDAHGLSPKIHAGDSLKIENGSLVFHTVGDTGAGHTLIDAKGTITPLDSKFIHDNSSHVPAPAVHESVRPIETAAQPDVTLHDAPVPDEIQHMDPSLYLPNIGPSAQDLDIHLLDHSDVASHPVSAEAHPIPTDHVPQKPELPSSTTPASLNETGYPSGSLEPYINANHVPITPQEPSVYSYLDAKGKEIHMLYGGLYDDHFGAAQDYLGKNPGSTIRFQIEQTDLLTGVKTYPVIQWSSNSLGQPIIPQLNAFVGENALPVPKPSEFIHKLEYTYKKT